MLSHKKQRLQVFSLKMVVILGTWAAVFKHSPLKFKMEQQWLRTGQGKQILLERRRLRWSNGDWSVFLSLSLRMYMSM